MSADVREVALTRGYVALVDAEDFESVSKWKWHAHVGSKRRGGPGSVYAYRREWPSRRLIALHREILNPPIDRDVDHINGDTLDCRKANLRPVTPQQNAWNQRIQRRGSSQFKGVSWNKHARKWSAQIKKSGKHTHLGYFMDERDAAKAYNAAALLEFGEFAKFNELENANA
jgi:hypothetical protein